MTSTIIASVTPAPSSLGTNVVTGITNLTTEPVNGMVSAPNIQNDSCPFSVIGLMVLGVILGSVGSFCYQRVVDPKNKPKGNPGEPANNLWGTFKQFLREAALIFGMGLAAVALVPAFLRTVSSNLIKETESSLESKLVFLGFCVAATLVAKRLIGTFPEKLLNLANEAKEQAAAAEAENSKLAKVVAERMPQPDAIRTSREARVASGKTDYDSKTEDVIRALLNPKYAQGRTVPGLAFDAGWTVAEIQEALGKLQRNGDADVFIGNPTKGALWYLTRAARQKFAGLIQSGGTQIAEAGIQ